MIQKGVGLSHWVLLAVGLSITLTPAALAQNVQKFPRHLPETLLQQPSGRLAAGKHLHLSIALPLRNESALDRLLAEISDPAAPNFHRYITPQQFAETFGPSASDYQSVIDYFQKHGFTVTEKQPNRLFLEVEGSVADIERVFHVSLRTYHHPGEGRDFYAPDVEPSLDMATRISGVDGLTDFHRPMPKIVMPSANETVTATSKSGTGSGPGGNLVGNDFRSTYAPGVSLTGAGQTVALVQFDGYYLKDITNYEYMIGIAQSNYVALTNVLVDGFSGTPTTGSTSGNGEVSLDIEMVIAMAPGISRIVVYEGNPATGSFFPNHVLNRIATETNVPANQISCSWGWSGGPDPATENIFKQMMAQGQTFFNASGDSDAFITNQVDNPSLPNEPSSSTNIVQVGATTLITTNPVLETVWNWGTYRGTSSDGVGSSGGISLSNAIPFWQTNINIVANHGSATKRNIPDVAMVGDNIFTKNGNGLNSTNVAGTSCAAPLWAGFAALVNQQAALNGRPPIGFINPAVYALGTGASRAAYFHDVTLGNNSWNSSATNYPAVAGYDLCTGLGTPNGMDLINALAAPDALEVSPGKGFDAVGPPGSLDVTSLTFTLTNSGGSPIDWQIRNLPPWLSVSATNGTVAGGSSASVTASLNSIGNNLLPGFYYTNIIFTNLTAQVAHARFFSVQMQQSMAINGMFERGDFVPWTLKGTGQNINCVTTNISAMTSHTGQYFAALGEYNGSMAYLTQPLQTVPGQDYQLSFWLRNPSSSSGKIFFVNWLTNSINTNRLFTIRNPTLFNWSNIVYVITATETNTILQIGASNSPDYWGLDDLTLRPIPDPSFRAISISNTMATLAWNSITTRTYRVQYSTNLASSWITLFTNAAAGDITTTNITSADPSRFYRVQRLP